MQNAVTYNRTDGIPDRTGQIESQMEKGNPDRSGKIKSLMESRMELDRWNPR
jgi:hypothetical protein